MRSSELLSKEWCDVIFENRNKKYGAYRLRERAGARYRLSLIVVFGAFFLLVLFHAGLSLYMRYLNAEGMKEAQEALSKLRTSDLKEGYKVKFVATARLVPAEHTSPDARSLTVPDIVDGTPEAAVRGVKSNITFDPEQVMNVSPVIDTTGTGNAVLPIVKEKIVETETVNQLPQFPGGPAAFMKWMDEHIVYPQLCIDRKQSGNITVSFIVGTDGYATDLQVKDAFDAQIYRSVKNAFKRMPKWTPGRNKDGELTAVQITVPVKFQL